MKGGKEKTDRSVILYISFKGITFESKTQHVTREMYVSKANTLVCILP